MRENNVKQSKNTSQRVYETLLAQNAILEDIIAQQKIVHVAVTNKQWKLTEDALRDLNTLTENFRELEQTRVQLCEEICPENPKSMTEVAEKLPLVFKTPFISTFHEVRQKLTVSKIENKAINDYIRITQTFLQGVMESVIPQRRNKVYSRTGAIVKNQPESVVLNTYM
jgi:hypothetical protein